MTQPRVSIQTHDFDVSAEIAALRAGQKGVGAVCCFVGTVRDRNEGASVATMELEHYPGMTERAIEAMIDAALPKAAPGGGGSGIESILGEPRQAQPGSAGVIEAMMGNDARKDDPRAKPQQEAAVKVQDGPAAPMTQPKSPGDPQSSLLVRSSRVCAETTTR